jgi:hypothetical protein
MGAIARHLPLGELPPTGYSAHSAEEWFYGDEQERYRTQGGHPIYGEHDIVYRMNALGYRCEEFDRSADVRLVAIGCSYVLGVGVAEAHLFHQVLAARLQAATARSVVAWNLALAGASNDYIARLLCLAVPVLKPHIVLINFTHCGRREYLSVQNRYMNYVPNYTAKDEVTRSVFTHFEALTSPLDDQLNFFRNYKTVAAVLDRSAWFYSVSNPYEIQAVEQHLDRSRYVGQFRLIDKARDQRHPGPASHAALADLYWSAFEAAGGARELVTPLQ